MATIISIIIFGLISYIAIRIIHNSMAHIHYFPNDEKTKCKINQVKTRLKEKWDIEPGNLWIPLDGEISLYICYFKTNEFNKNFGLIRFSGLMNQIEQGSIYSFGEANNFSQIDKLTIEKYPGLDTYYTNYSADWIIYITHENTIAFGGPSVINIIKNEWPDWANFINPWEKEKYK
jgi:hypothetical protein